MTKQSQWMCHEITSCHAQQKCDVRDPVKRDQVTVKKRTTSFPHDGGGNPDIVRCGFPIGAFPEGAGGNDKVGVLFFPGWKRGL